MSSQWSGGVRDGRGKSVTEGEAVRPTRRFTPGGGLYVEGAPPQTDGRGMPPAGSAAEGQRGVVSAGATEAGATEVVRETDGEIPVVTIRPAPARLKLV